MAGCPPVRRAACGIALRTSSDSRALFVNGSVSRSRTIRSAIRRANFSSPYWNSTRASSAALYVLTMSAAVVGPVESIRMSSGASCA